MPRKKRALSISAWVIFLSPSKVGNTPSQARDLGILYLKSSNGCSYLIKKLFLFRAKDAG
jgi:hypothetical protein